MTEQQADRSAADLGEKGPRPVAGLPVIPSIRPAALSRPTVAFSTARPSDITVTSETQAPPGK